MSQQITTLSFHVGQVFQSYLDLERAISKYESTQFVQLQKRDTTKIDDNNLKYSKIIYCCKAGGKNYSSKSKGFRKASSFKTDCPFKIIVRAAKEENVLKVTTLNNNHTCQISGKQEVYERLPRQRRPDEEQLKFILDVKSCLGNTKALITKFQEEHEKVITGKDIENVIRKAKKEEEGKTDFERLLVKMRSHKGSSVFVEHDDNIVECIFFQDLYMQRLYKSFPEILLIDATYKINQNRMCLMCLMVVDGNGDSGIVGLAFLRSESESCTLAALKFFAESSGGNQETQIIMADKDMGNRNAFEKVFPHSKIHVCIFHVMQAFTREITREKRNITMDQKEKALNLMKKMVYAESDEIYFQLYEALLALGSQEVADYFNTNWHSIRDQWTMFGQNTVFHLMTRTNNRLERFNRDLHDTTLKYGEICQAFDNVMKAITAMRTERDKKAIDMIVKKSGVVYNDSLGEYQSFLTGFAFKKVLTQYESSTALSKKIPPDEISFINHRNRRLKITLNDCECGFFTVMRLPCRHILALSSNLNKDIFRPDLCSPRWTVNYFARSKSWLLEKDEISMGDTIFGSQLNQSKEKGKPQTQSQKFREVKNITMELAEIASHQPEHLYDFIFQELQSFKRDLIMKLGTIEDDEQAEQCIEVNSEQNKSNFSCFCGINRFESFDLFMCCYCKKLTHATCHGYLNAYSRKYHTRFDPNSQFTCWLCPDGKYSDRDLKMISEGDRKIKALKRLAVKLLLTKKPHNEIPEVSDAIKNLEKVDIEPLIKQLFVEIEMHLETDPDDMYHEDFDGEIFDHYQHIEDAVTNSTSSQNEIPNEIFMARDESQLPPEIDHNYTATIASLQLPPVPLNIRPRGARCKKSKTVTLKTFNEMTTQQKRKRMLIWIMGEKAAINIMDGIEKIESEDLKNIDALTWQKFRNAEIEISQVQSFFDDTAYLEFEKKLVSLKKARWICGTCKKTTGKANVIFCDSCFNWYHFRCVGLDKSPRKEFYLCPDCNSL